MKTIIVAEAGVNHNGKFALAKRMVKVAAKAGADFIKFQTFDPSSLATDSVPKAAYQKQATGAHENQKKMLEKLCLLKKHYKLLQKECKKNNIGFLSTAFDSASLEFVESLKPAFHKISSGDIDNISLLRQAARYGRPILLSTGMARIDEIGRAFKTLLQAGLDRDQIVLLQCHTEYPTRVEEVNLRVMDSFRKKFRTKVGFSDHTEGITVSLAAAARGAEVIEKHFTLDRMMRGPDYQASLSPPKLIELVSGIREIEKALGDGCKKPSIREKRIMKQARKYLVSLQPIRSGDKFTPTNLGVKRSGGGIPAALFDRYLGKKANRDYQCDEAIEN